MVGPIREWIFLVRTLIELSFPQVIEIERAILEIFFLKEAIKVSSKRLWILAPRSDVESHDRLESDVALY